MTGDEQQAEIEALRTIARMPSTYSVVAAQRVARDTLDRVRDARNDEPPPIEEDAPYWRQKYEEVLHMIPERSNPADKLHDEIMQGDPTVPWQQWNDEVNARINVQIELLARLTIRRRKRESTKRKLKSV